MSAKFKVASPINVKKESYPNICGINIEKYSRTWQLAICVFSIFILFILYGYYQEMIFQVEELRKNGLFVTLVQFGFYTIFSFRLEFVANTGQERAPVKMYVLLAFLTMGTMGFSNTSLGYLNYPTQVIFKSSKLIPVMFGGILIQGKKYKWIDFAACITMTFGLIIFSYGDQSISPNFNLTGIALISMALCCDAMIGNFQELILRKFNTNNSEMVFCSYGMGFILLLVFNFFYGSVISLSVYVIKNPWSLVMIFLFSLTGYVGILFVLHLVRSFGALLAVTVTTCRKAVTIVLSFVFFTKPFTMQYLWGGVLVLLGIVLNVASKNQEKIKEAFAKIYAKKQKLNEADDNFVV